MSRFQKVKLTVPSTNLNQSSDGMLVRKGDFDPIVDGLNAIIPDASNPDALSIETLAVSGATALAGTLAAGATTITGALSASGKATATGGVSQGTANVTEFTVLTTITATEIVGTAAGDIGHTDGAILVAAPSSAYALEFVSAVFIFDYATAAYTGGANDMVVRVGSTAVSSAFTDTNCITATGDKVFRLGAIATEKSLGVGSTINIAGTAFTQPGTAAGVLRVYTTYRIVTTGL